MMHRHEFGVDGHGECPIRKDLTLLAAGIDTRFLRAGTTLAGVVDTIDRIVRGLDDIAGALDRKTAGAAVVDLLAVADTLTALPATQERRGVQMDAVAQIAHKLEDSVLQMSRDLRVLGIYGMNIKIAASGEPQFVSFVNGMLAKLGLGESQLAGFLAKLKTLRGGIGGVEQAERLLVDECGKILPHVPVKLARDAAALDGHLGEVAAMAARTAGIARSVQGKVAVVLGALQVGDSTRQRLEHVVSSLQMLDADPAVDGFEAAAAHVDRLLAAQLEATARDYESAMTALVGSLDNLDGDLDGLRTLIAAQSGNGKGRGFLGELESSITDIQLVTSQLSHAESQSQEMAVVITATVVELTGRLASTRRIRVDVQDIATNTRLLCRRHGTSGKAVAVVAAEVDAYAVRLGKTTEQVGLSIAELGRIDGALRGEIRDAGAKDIGTTLSDALRVIREGCESTGQVTSRGEDDVKVSKDMVWMLRADVVDDTKLSGRMETSASVLAARRAACEPDEAARTFLSSLLPAMARLYTMAQERDVHAGFLLPGMEPDLPPPAAAADDDDDDDGLF